MSAQKTLSQLSFAAIALVITSIPCFAQTETAATEKAYTSAQVAVANNVRRMFRTEPLVVAPAGAKQKQPTFSATEFMQAVDESCSLDAKPTSSTPAFVVNSFDNTKLDLEKPASSKRITFVPSKGPRLPQ